MDEKILPILLLDEAIALFLVEPLHLILHSLRYPSLLLMLLRISQDIVWPNKKGHWELYNKPNGHSYMFPKTTIRLISEVYYLQAKILSIKICLILLSFL